MAPKTRKTWNALRHENLQHNSTWSLDMVTFSLRPGKIKKWFLSYDFENWFGGLVHLLNNLNYQQED